MSRVVNGEFLLLVLESLLGLDSVLIVVNLSHGLDRNKLNYWQVRLYNKCDSLEQISQRMRLTWRTSLTPFLLKLLVGVLTKFLQTFMSEAVNSLFIPCSIARESLVPVIKLGTRIRATFFLPHF